MSYEINLSSSKRSIDNALLIEAITETIGMEKNSITPIDKVYTYLKSVLNINTDRQEKIFRSTMRTQKVIETPKAIIRIDRLKNFGADVKEPLHLLEISPEKFLIVVTVKKQVEQVTEAEQPEQTETETTPKPTRIKRT